MLGPTPTSLLLWNFVSGSGLFEVVSTATAVSSSSVSDGRDNVETVVEMKSMDLHTHAHEDNTHTTSYSTPSWLPPPLPPPLQCSLLRVDAMRLSGCALPPVSVLRHFPSPTPYPLPHVQVFEFCCNVCNVCNVFMMLLCAEVFLRFNETSALSFH